MVPSRLCRSLGFVIVLLNTVDKLELVSLLCKLVGLLFPRDPELDLLDEVVKANELALLQWVTGRKTHLLNLDLTLGKFILKM